jgi:hypothetical protein
MSLAIVSTYVMLSVLFFLVHPRSSWASEMSLGPAGGRPAEGFRRAGKGTPCALGPGKGWGCQREYEIVGCGIPVPLLCLMPRVR